jgi:hypothetical protein
MQLFTLKNNKIQIQADMCCYFNLNTQCNIQGHKHIGVEKEDCFAKQTYFH